MSWRPGTLEQIGRPQSWPLPRRSSATQGEDDFRRMATEGCGRVAICMPGSDVSIGFAMLRISTGEYTWAAVSGRWNEERGGVHAKSVATFADAERLVREMAACTSAEEAKQCR